MCITSGEARLTSTRIYACETNGFTDTDEPAHVLMYQNQAENLSSGPNCMLLHLPSAERMTENNMVKTSQVDKFLDGLIEATKRKLDQTLSYGVLSAGVASRGFEIFERGIYTVILAEKPSAIYKALKLVPEHKRPKIKGSLLRFYQKHFPGWTLALCCFDNREAHKATPLVFWYKPKFPDLLFAPGVDSHDGNPPDFVEPVNCDHEVVFGTTLLPPDTVDIRLQDWKEQYGFDTNLIRLMPSQAFYGEFTWQHRNADFVLPIANLYAHRGKKLHERIRDEFQDGIRRTLISPTGDVLYGGR